MGVHLQKFYDIPAKIQSMNSNHKHLFKPMKMNKIQALIAILSLAPHFFSFGQVNVLEVSNPARQPASNGIYYMLPRTSLRIEVVVKTEQNARGPLAEFANRYLGITDAILADNTSYTISKVAITPIPEPDPGQVYFIETTPSDPKEAGKLSVLTDESGFLLSVNTLDDFNLLPAKVVKKITVEDEELLMDNADEFAPAERVIIITDTILRRIAVDTTLVEQLSFRTRATDKTDADLAAETMEKIEEIREARFRLLTGFQETPYETGTIIYMDEELKKLEEEYLAMFRGKSRRFFEYYTFYYIPAATHEKLTVPLFRFSSVNGIGNIESGNGDVAGLLIEPAGTGALIEGFSGAAPSLSAGNGIAFRVPATAKVTLNIGKEIIHTEQITINQLGAIQRLPVQKFKAEFSPATGSITKLMLN
ncbi:MAG: DUF4831 family protein [Sphingobacteriia bacterium]|nr:DUF4831 family protein [Sphingobacteriia bacterium]